MEIPFELLLFLAEDLLLNERMSIVRELKFAERGMRSGRDLEDQDVADCEFKSSNPEEVRG